MDLGEMEVRDGGRGEARNFSPPPPPLPHPFCSFPSPFLSSPSSSSSSLDKPLDGMQRKREEGEGKIEAEFLHCLGSSLDRRRRPPFAHPSSIPENRPAPRGVHGEEKKKYRIQPGEKLNNFLKGSRTPQVKHLEAAMSHFHFGESHTAP